MRRMDFAMQEANSSDVASNYCGPLVSTSSNGKTGNINNLSSSQVGGQMMMPYGISSHPVRGVRAQAIVNGDDDTTIVGIYDKNRPNTKPGEICIYSHGGASIYLTNDGYIDIKCKGLMVNGREIS